MSSPVVLAAVVLYFGVVSVVLGLVILPSWRERGAELAGRVLGPLRRTRPAAAAPAAPSRWQVELAAALDADTLPPRHGVLALLTAAVVAAGPGAALLLHEHLYATPDAPPKARAFDAHLAALLAGERLVAPAPLPPEWFRTESLLRERPFTADANRDWALLHPLFRQRLLAVFAAARERHGYELVLLEGYRSPQRQTQLAAQGPATTRASADQSRHQAGLAADVAFRRDGRLLVSEHDPWTRQAYLHYGQIAKSFGLDWGGDWKSIRDLGHVEMQPQGANSALPIQADGIVAAH